jgi:hypothetical protein
MDAETHKLFMESLDKYYTALEKFPPDWQQVALAADDDVAQQNQHATEGQKECPR